MYSSFRSQEESVGPHISLPQAQTDWLAISLLLLLLPVPTSQTSPKYSLLPPPQEDVRQKKREKKRDKSPPEEADPAEGNKELLPRWDFVMSNSQNSYLLPRTLGMSPCLTLTPPLPALSPSLLKNRTALRRVT